MPAPKRRYLSGNKGSEGPSELLFFDTESYQHVSPTDPDTRCLTLRLWCATALRLERGEPTRRTTTCGKTASELWRFIESRQSKSRYLWVFAHNLGFDLTMASFWDRLDTREYTIGPVDRGISPRTGRRLKSWQGRLCLEARPTYCVVQGVRGKVRFVDTANYYPTKLEDIGIAHGLTKLPFPKWEDSDEVWFEYCRRDVDVCEVAMVNLITKWTAAKCGIFRMTAPGLAFTNYKHTATCRDSSGEKVNIVLEDDSPARALERDGYYGGRIEPFYIGKIQGPVYHVDCNSLYPAMMSGSLYPRARVQSYDSIEPSRLSGLLHAYGAVSRVLISSNTNTYVTRRNGVQIHCSGRFWTSLVGPELCRALQAGDVAACGETHTYSMCDLFTTWVDVWYKRKSDARSAGPSGFGDYEFSNLILKSISGKWAQKGEYWTDHPDVCPRGRWGSWFGPERTTDETQLWRAVAGIAQCKIRGREPSEAYPIISAYITSYAREYMRGIFGDMPDKSLLYTGTDSIVCTSAGYRHLEHKGLIHPTEMGKFKLVDGALCADIRGPNYYRIGGRSCRSGAYGRAKLVPGVGWRADQWQQLPSILGSKPDGGVRIHTSTLSPSRVTSKGTTGIDGWVRPLHMAGDESMVDDWPSRRGCLPDPQT